MIFSPSPLLFACLNSPALGEKESFDSLLSEA